MKQISWQKRSKLRFFFVFLDAYNNFFFFFVRCFYFENIHLIDLNFVFALNYDLRYGCSRFGSVFNVHVPFRYARDIFFWVAR